MEFSILEIALIGLVVVFHQEIISFVKDLINNR